MIKESDLYEPVRILFETLGYTVRAEVKDADVVAVCGDETIIIELKRNLSVELLSQCVQRQRITDIVYAAVPKPKNYTPKSEIAEVLKKLEIGLIFVTVNENVSFAQIAFDPQIYKGKRISKVLKRSLANEFSQRKCSANKGGISGVKIATAYAEKAVHIACMLEKYGAMSPSGLVRLGSDRKKTGSILYNNYYGWFEHEKRGVYRVKDNWREKAEGYDMLIDFYAKSVKEMN